MTGHLVAAFIEWIDQEFGVMTVATLLARVYCLTFLTVLMYLPVQNLIYSFKNAAARRRDVALVHRLAQIGGWL